MKIISDDEIKNMTKCSHKSELWEYKESIEKMRMANITYKDIKEWLSNEGVVTSMENIRQFYLRNCVGNIARKPNNKMQTKENEVLDMFANI